MNRAAHYELSAGNNLFAVTVFYPVRNKLRGSSGRTAPGEVGNFAKGEDSMSLGTILVIILIIFLLGGFSGQFGGYGYGFGHGGVGVIGVILIVVLVLAVLGRV